jgi:quinol monooxygenase YgiN
VIFVIARLTIKPGSEAALLAAYAPLHAATIQEPGCIAYELHKALSTENTYVFVERWETREAIAAHMDMPHVKAWRVFGAEHVVARKLEIIHPAKIETP